MGSLPVDVYPHERQYGYQVYKAVERKDVVQARYPWILMFRILEPFFHQLAMDGPVEFLMAYKSGYLPTASQITNPLAWMEVDNREAASYFSAHAKVNINLPYRLKLVVFGSYTYIECPYGRVVKVRRES